MFLTSTFFLNQRAIEDRLIQEISICLAGTPAAHQICDPLCASSSFRGSFRTNKSESLSAHGTLEYVDGRPAILFINKKEMQSERKSSVSGAEMATESAKVLINMSEKPDVVSNLVLSLKTLGFFSENNGLVTIRGKLVPVLPFVRDVAGHYLRHPSAEVRRAAALTCCSLLIPFDIAGNDLIPFGAASTQQQDTIHAIRKRVMGTHSGVVIEEVLTKLLQVAVSDPSPIVRLCVVRGLDERYDYFLCQAHHLQPLFFLLQDEMLATRAAGLQLLGRLTRLNPAPILPVMRQMLVELIVELKCGGDTGRAREEATRLLVVYLRAEPLQRLVQNILPSLVEALPLTGVAPRLASAALEALGELATASKASLAPWVKQVIPHIMETMQDQSSASKQRTSLKTLGQISGSTGYVISPYVDYPQLLSRATDVLPGTKRAPWALRREVIRTLGIVGALDPDQYHTFVPKTRKGGAVGGGYFLEQDVDEEEKDSAPQSEAAAPSEPQASSTSESRTGADRMRDSDDDSPAHLYMYEQYAMVAQPVSTILPPQRMTPSDEEFYPTVAIQALTRIFKDPSLAVHHGMVMQAIMFIFNFLGQKCVPFLNKVVPHMLFTIRTCSPSNLREALLKQVASLSSIVREHLRPYVAEIFGIVDDFWNSKHLGTILALLSKIAVGVPDDFKMYLPRLIRKLLASLEEIQTSDSNVEINKLDLILRSIRSLRGVMNEYLHLMVPSLLKLADSLILPPNAEGEQSPAPTYLDVAVVTLQTLSHLLEHDRARNSLKGLPMVWGEWTSRTDSMPLGCSLAARATQPITRLLSHVPTSSKQVGYALIETICVCARQLGQKRWMSLYHDATRNTISAWCLKVGILAESQASETQAHTDSRVIGNHAPNGLQLYDSVIAELKNSGLQRHASLRLVREFRRESFVQDSSRHPRSESVPNSGDALADTSLDQSSSGFQTGPVIPPPVMNPTTHHRVNQGNLQRAWDVSQKASREDWDEWMRRFGIQLLREAPSPALRATASLAHAYQPLARELFSAAFVCCWGELNEQYRQNLVEALQSAFVADVSPEILQTLLNLAEFMEHDGVGSAGLPIDISNLAELALKCRSYAKALHYKECEYNQGPSASGACLEALISINKKLDLPGGLIFFSMC